MEIPVHFDGDHLFRYPSEWNPVEGGSTKGGYLEGGIQLPLQDNIRVVLSTYSTVEPYNVHPTMFHLVRKGEKGRTRAPQLETVPNPDHWQLELLVKENYNVFVKNRTRYMLQKCSFVS